MQSQPPQPVKKGMGAAGCIVVALVVVFVVLPIFGILGIYGVRKYLVAAKGAEARNALMAIGRGASDAWDVDHKLCASASSPVPADASAVAARKYMSTDAEWSADEAKNAGFACLHFSMSTPQYFQYDYQAINNFNFVATARGDFDGDGVMSELSLSGGVVDNKIQLGQIVEKDVGE